jgi:hypothetical protein
MKGRPVNPTSLRQQKLRNKLPGTVAVKGRPINPLSSRQHLIRNKVDYHHRRGRLTDRMGSKSSDQHQLVVPVAQNTKYMSFAEIIQGRESNVKMSKDGLIYAVDMVMVITGKNRNNSCETLRAMKPSLFNNEKFVIYNKRKLLSFQHAIELVMVLPGRVAKETRTQFSNIIRRYVLQS